MISAHRFDGAKLTQVDVRNGDWVQWMDSPINDADCVAGFGEFRKGVSTGSFVLWYDEVQYALSGKARLVYRLPPTYDKEYQLEVRDGDMYLLRTGAQVRFEVEEENPYQVLYVAMPRPKSIV